MDPNRLQLRRIPGSTIYFIWHQQKWIGTVDSVPAMTIRGIQPPAILLRRVCTEQLIDRIRDLVNKRDGTNRTVAVIPPPPSMEHPAIQRFMLHGK